jgi:hypothetical protein
VYMPVTREYARKTHTHTHTHVLRIQPVVSVTRQAVVVLVSRNRAQRPCIAIILSDAISLKQEQLRVSLDKPHVYRYQLNENTRKRN